MKFLKGKRILVTGACGTVGSELFRLLCADNIQAEEVRGIDNNESELFFLEQRYLENKRTSFFVADIRDRNAVFNHTKGMDVVFHAAALKHVVLCERSPMEAVQSNILGVENIISSAREAKVERVIFTSSDKAVNPTNVMGTSKLMGERLMTAANSTRHSGDPVFASTRFGNVLGSNGSVIPIFHRQIAKGGPVTLTDPDMTRFVMTVEEAVRLVIDSAGLVRGGEVFITKMPVIRIQDLADVMVELLAPRYGHKPEDIKIVNIGTKPGEKLYEELMSSEETRRAVELDRYFSVLPAFRGLYQDIQYNYEGLISDQVTDVYESSTLPVKDKKWLCTFLIENSLLAETEMVARQPDKRYWPGDK